MVWVLCLLRCSCSSRRKLQPYCHQAQLRHPPTRSQPCGLLIHCYSNQSHGCVVSASHCPSSRADWCLLMRRHHLQCHPREYTEIRVSRYRPVVPANGSQSRLAMGLRVLVATSTGLGYTNGITSTHLGVSRLLPMATSLLGLGCKCNSIRTQQLQRIRYRL